ncbi:MAG: ABC transporter substrate-binding protein [Deltaproteobacteria bacterium]|nr:ABC transporter substrate-binding protein [Deltaproteobacteria bacterium]
MSAPTPRAATLAFALALAVTMVAGCPKKPTETTLPLVTTDDPVAEADLEEARERAANGDAPGARSGYEGFLRDHPEDPLVPIAQLELGQLLLAEGRYEEARAQFAPVAEHEDEAVAERGSFYLGVAMHLLGDSTGAIERLRPMVGRTVDPRETALLLQTLGAAAEQTGDRIGAVEAYDTLLSEAVPEDDKHQARERLAQVISRLEAQEAYVLFGRLNREGETWPSVTRRAAQEAFTGGDLGRVAELIHALEEADVPLDEELRAMALRAGRTGQVHAQAIGAILPLSGRGREVGQNALHGLMIAAGMPLQGPPSRNTPRLHFRDSGGDPERARAAVDDLATLHQVVAIIGPVSGEAAVAAAERAEELGVPLLSLAPDGRLVDRGEHVFRIFSGPTEEAAALVRAARARGATRFASLHPAHGYGRAMTRALREAAEAAGAQWAGAVSYDPAATSFGEPIDQLAALSFDALLVPDAGRRIALVAPALAAKGLWSGSAPQGGRVVQLLLPSPAVDRALVQNAARYVQGALFASQFHAASATGESAGFVSAFRDRFGSEPDAYAAAAYDGFRLVARAVATTRRGDEVDRGRVTRWLAQSGGFATAGSSGGLGATRGPAQLPRVLELRDGVFTPLR